MRVSRAAILIAVLLAVVLVFSVLAASAATAPKAKAKPAASATAKTQKPAKCPPNRTELSGCVQTVSMKSNQMVVNCNGLDHKVVITRNATITINKKPAKAADLAKLKPGTTRVTVTGKCGQGTTFEATKVAASTAAPAKPKP